MSNTIAIVCPQCEKKFAAPPEVAGKRVKCKGCGEAFVAKAIGAKAAAPAKAKVAATKKAVAEVAPVEEVVPVEEVTPVAAVDDDDDSNPYAITDADTGHRCPHCANEMENEDSVVCLNCGYNTETRTQVKTHVVADQGFIEYTLWLGPAILCLLLCIGLITWNIIYDLYVSEWFDEKHWLNFLGHLSIRMWMGIISTFIVYLAGRFGIVRLFFHTKPPEIELKDQKR